MKKRIFSLITVVAVMMSLLAVNVSATTFTNNDFNEANLNLNDGTVYKKSDIPANAAFEVSQQNGTLYYYKEAGFRYDKNKHTPDQAALDDGAEWQLSLPDLALDKNMEIILEYDFMVPDYDAMDDADFIYSDIYIAGIRQSWQLHRHRIKTGSGGWGRNLYFTDIYPESEGGHEGKWMTFAHHYYYNENSENASKWDCDVYGKPQGAEEWSVAVENHNMSTNANDRIRFFVYGDYDMKVYFDNIRVYTGTELMSGEMMMDGTKIEAVEDVTPGELSATATVSTTEPKDGFRKIMVAYDKSGKMIDCTTTTQSLGLGSNPVSAELELDETAAAAVADGGYVGFYLWDGMLPYIDAVEIK